MATSRRSASIKNGRLTKELEIPKASSSTHLFSAWQYLRHWLVTRSFVQHIFQGTRGCEDACRKYSHQVTIMPRDLQLARRLRGDFIGEQ